MADDVVAMEEHTELGVLLIDGAVLEVADSETREVVGRVADRARDAMLRDLFEVLTPEAMKTHLARVREDLRSPLLQVMGVPSTGKPTLPACEQLLRSLRRASPEQRKVAALALGDPCVPRVLSTIEPGQRRREALHALADEVGATVLAIALVDIGAHADPQQPWPYAFAIQLATDVVTRPSLAAGAAGRRFPDREAA